MPLADDGRRITGLFQELGQRDFTFGEVQAVGGSWIATVRRGVLHHAIAKRIPPRHQRRASWCAKRGWAIEMRQSCALGSESIEIWRFERLMTITGQIAIAQIIRHDQHDVWPGERYRTVTGKGSDHERE